MPTVQVVIQGNDRKLGAMVKALAFEIGNARAVKGASWAHMAIHGHLEFTFESKQKVEEFRNAVATYLPAKFARVVAEKC